MIEIQGAAALGGYVRAVFSGRVNGFALPLDLVKAQAKTAARVAMRRRLSRAFSGYLVTDHPAEFSEHRRAYQSGVESWCVTGGRAPLDAPISDKAGGPLDAPEMMAGGSCDEVGFLFGGSSYQTVALREYISGEPEEAAFSPRRDYWLNYAGGLGIGITGPLGGPSFVYVREGFENENIDAPEFMAAGSWRWLDYTLKEGGFVSQRSVMRGRAC